MSNILEIKDLSKNFGGVKALQDISFNITRGEIMGLIGPNGAGKTTLFNCVAGVEKPSAGHIIFRREEEKAVDLAGKKPEKVTALGVARTFQNIRLFDTLTVLDNVKIGRHSRTKSNFFGAVLHTPAQKEEEQAVEDAARRTMEFVGLTADPGAVAASLAYGEQRRLEIARALASDPALIMLDEPAAGMNPHESKQLMDLIKRVRDSGVSVLLIEHDMKVVMGVCQRVVVINYGQWLAEGPPHEVAKSPEVVEAYLGSGAASCVA